jgi:hypothetical protein
LKKAAGDPLKRIFALVSLLVAGNVWAANVKQFDLNGQDVLTIAVPQAIRVRLAQSENGKPPQLILSDTNNTCEMHVTLAKNDGKLSDDQIKGRLLAEGQKLLPAVVEKEVKLQKLGGNTFTYFYFELTDSRTDPTRGNRSIVQGLGRSTQYVCEFVMLTSRKNADIKAQVLNSLRSIDIRTKK